MRYYIHHKIQPYRYRQADVGDLVGDIKDNRERLGSNAESRYCKARRK